MENPLAHVVARIESSHALRSRSIIDKYPGRLVIGVGRREVRERVIAIAKRVENVTISVPDDYTVIVAEDFDFNVEDAKRGYRDDARVYPNGPDECEHGYVSGCRGCDPDR